MGYYCAASMCWSADHKRKNLNKYPWMADVRWVKFPKDTAARSKWKKLLRRKDKFELTRTSRLCSRHFDETQIGMTGHATGVPKYFFWNNYGYDQRNRDRDSAAIMERNRAVTQAPVRPELRAGGSQLAAASSQLFSRPTSSHSRVMLISLTKLMIAGEVTVDQCPNPDEITVGHMNLLQDTVEVPPPQDHDYIVHRQPPTETSVQTDLTARDMELLEKRFKPPQVEHPVQDLVIDHILSSDGTSDLVHWQ